MRRLPSEPASETYKHNQYKIQKAIQTRMAWVILVSYVALTALLLTFFFSSSLWRGFKNNVKYTLNGIDCEILVSDFEKGSSVLIKCEGKIALIDFGKNGHEEELLKLIESEKTEKLDYLFVSELDEDYLSIMDRIVESVEVIKIVFPSTDNEDLYTLFDNALFMDGRHFITAKESMYNYFENMSLDYIESDSAIMKISFGNHSFLIYDSCSEERELEIINSNLDADVFISLNGDLPCDKFLETITPEVIVIKSNENSEIELTSAEKFSDEIYRTDLNGDIIIKSNEIDLEIECENQ